MVRRVVLVAIREHQSDIGTKFLSIAVLTGLQFRLKRQDRLCLPLLAGRRQQGGLLDGASCCLRGLGFTPGHGRKVNVLVLSPGEKGDNSNSQGHKVLSECKSTHRVTVPQGHVDTESRGRA